MQERETAMSRFGKQSVWSVALVGLGLLCGRQIAAAALPGGEELLDKYVTVTGGKEAYEKCTNRVSSGTMEISGPGIKGKITVYQAAPNKMYTSADLPGVGKIEEGTDGQTVWERNPLSGPRVKKDDEKANALRDALFNGELNWRKVYKKAECVAEEMVDGKPCYKVDLTMANGKIRSYYLDKASGLAVKLTSTEKTQLGEIPTEVTVSDYKKVDGLLIPHTMRQKALTQVILITFDKIEHNAKLPEDRFAIPEDIKKLADKDKPGK
jgi:hypothetical protein